MHQISEPIRALCFDAVGTLIFPDPPAHLVYAEVGRKFGSRLDQDAIRRRFREAFAEEERRDLEDGLRTDEAREVRRWQYIVGAVLEDVADRAACFHELYQHFSRPEAWRCAPQAADVLEQLAGRYLLALASNYDRRLRGVAAGLPELKSISHLIISSEVGWRKPAVPFFEAVCRSLNLAPSQVLFIGDDLVNDYQGARAAGLAALLFDPSPNAAPPGINRLANLRELSCDPCQQAGRGR